VVSRQGGKGMSSSSSVDSRCSKVSAITYEHEREDAALAETEDPLQTWKLTFTDAVLEEAYLVRELTASAMSLYGQRLVLL